MGIVRVGEGEYPRFFHYRAVVRGIVRWAIIIISSSSSIVFAIPIEVVVGFVGIHEEDGRAAQLLLLRSSASSSASSSRKLPPNVERR